MGDDVESNTGVDLAAHVDAFYPGGAAPRQQRSSSMEDLGPAEVVPTTSDNDEKSVGGTSILSRGSSKLSEAADAAFKQLSADSDISLRFQALFQLSLIATATVSLFVWMPRATFGSTAAIDTTQQVADLLFAAIYTGGYAQQRRQEKARAMAKKMSMLDDVVRLTRNRWSAGALGHPANMVLHVGLGAIVPVCGDFVVWLLASPHDGGSEAQEIHQLVVVPGCLRLIHALGFGHIFKELDINLAVPHYPVFIIRNLLILCANTHVAACFFWTVAESSDFNEKTWVSSTSPELVNATLSDQYIKSLYLATFVVLVPTAFSPTSQIEILYTIFFVMLNIFIVANIIGGLSALQGMADQELAIHRRVCDEFEKMFQQHLISEDVVQATRQFLRMDAHHANADINQLPMAVRARIREQRFADTLISQPLFKGLSRRFIDACISCVHEDTYVAGLDVVRRDDVPQKCSIILDGFASIMVSDPEMDDENASSQSVATLVPGACFGQEGFITGTASPWTIQAKTIVRAVSFSEADRDALSSRFPHDFHKLRTNLLNSTMELEKTATRLAARMVEKAALEARQAETQAELDRNAARQLFTEFDTDGSGSLELSEIRSLVNRLGLPLSSTQVKDALGYMDWNGDGTVNVTEFMGWYDTARNTKSRDGVQSVMVDKMGKFHAQQTWTNLKNSFKASTIVKALQPPNAKRNLTGFVHGLSQRTKLHSLRIWMELPNTMTPSLVQELARSAADALIEIERDRSRASHDLAGLICHLAGTGDAVELDRMLSLVPITEIPSDYDGRAGLHLAAAGGHIDAVKCLLLHKADVNVIDRFGRTPIAEAVLNNKKEVLDLLRSKGAELQLSAQDCAGVLCEAANEGDNHLIQLYLDAGADANSADYDKRTALMLAAAEGGLQTCKLLVGAGAERGMKDRWGHTAGSEAIYHKHTGTILHLLNQDDYHVFISCVPADKALARQLHNSLTKMVLSETGQTVRVFLHEFSQVEGQSWDASAMEGLANSWIVCPIISHGLLENLQGLDNDQQEDSPHGVLMEMMGALELYARTHERATTKAILPVISPNRDNSQFDGSLVDQLSDYSHTASASTATRHLRGHVSSADLAEHEMLNSASQMLGDLVGSRENTMSVRDVFSAVMCFQGVELSARNNNEILRESLKGLTMSDIVARAPEQGVDEERVMTAMHNSGNPVETGIELIVNEALAVPQFAMDGCTGQIIAVVKTLLGGGAVLKGVLGQPPVPDKTLNTPARSSSHRKLQQSAQRQNRSQKKMQRHRLEAAAHVTRVAHQVNLAEAEKMVDEAP